MKQANNPSSSIDEHIAGHRDGYALAQYFYRSEHVYDLEKRCILFKSWLLAGYTCELSRPGDFIQFEIAGESVIVTRSQQNEIHALLNVCRHRGARVCERSHGNTQGFSCPYHGWIYDLDGRLRSARDFPGLDRAEHGLHQLAVVVFKGLVFVNFDANAEDFNPELALIGDALESFALEQAKIAHQNTYRVQANWKLALENYLECYHCARAHKAYAQSHSLEAPGADVAALNAAMLALSEQKTGISGLDVEHYYAYDEAQTPGGGVDCSRYALYEGYVTGSRDGTPLAPLMGAYTGFDGGAQDFQFGPLSFMLGYPDHCVVYRFTPVSHNECDMSVTWLVRQDAVPGKDYNVDDLTWLWHRTTQEDEYIISRNAAGVASAFFQPGPYHPEKEAMCIAFTRWYLQRLRKHETRDRNSTP